MRKFLQKISLLILPFIFLLIFLEILIRYIPNDYKTKRDYLAQHKDSITTLIIGGSNSYGDINPNYLKGNAYNLSHYSQTLEYDYALFNKYIDQLPNLKNLILSISYFTYYREILDFDEPYNSKNYYVYYKINSEIPLKYRFEITSLPFRVNLRRAFNFIIYNKTERTNQNKGFSPYLFHEKDLNFELSGKEAARRHSRITDRHYKMHLAYLNRIIEECEKRNIQVILVTLPTYKSYRTNLDTMQLKQTFTVTDSIAKKHKNTIYLNEFSNPEFKKKHFYNADHLNQTGAVIMSKKLNAYLQ